MISLNESQRRAILFSFLDIHQRMAEMEALLAQETRSPFSRYAHDLSPAEIELVRDRFAHMRNAMLTYLEEAGISLEFQQSGVRWALQCGMTFLSITIAEMGPEKLRGYGPVDEAGRASVLKMQEELNRHIDQIKADLRLLDDHDRAG